MKFISRKIFPACGSMCVCCPALRSRSRQPVKRYKKLLAEIFPKSPDAPLNDRKIVKLCEYAAKNPFRIPKITKYLEERCCKELRSEHIKFVNIVAEVYNKLLYICKEQMAYFAVNLLNVVVELLDNSKRDAVQIIGCQTFTRFIYSQVDGTYTYNIENLVHKVCTLAHLTGEDHQKRCLRASSLQCLSAMVWYMAEFSHIFVNFDEIVHVTLDNYEPDTNNEDIERGEAHHNWVDEVVRCEGRGGAGVGSEISPSYMIIRPRPEKRDPSLLTREEVGTPKVWAQICIQRMVELAKESTTMRLILDPMFVYFDTRRHWLVPQGLAMMVLSDMSYYVEYQGNQQFILTAVVRHLDHKNVLHDPKIKSDIIQTAAVLARQIRSKVVLSDIGYVNDLCRHMRKSLQASVLSVGEQELSLNITLQNSIEDCLRETAKGIADAHPLFDMMAITLENLPSSRIVARATIGSLMVLADMISLVSSHSKQVCLKLSMAQIPSSEASNSGVVPETQLKRASNDIGWKYGVLFNPKNADKVKCKLCGHCFSGGIYRIKQHIAQITGNVRPCPKATDEDKAKCKAALEEAKRKKQEKKKENEETRKEVNIIDEGEEEIEVIGSRKRPRLIGAMDKFASAINPDSSMSSSQKLRQQNINDALWKERTHSVHQYLARWVYEAAIPFNAIDCDSFKRFCESVGQYGPGYQPPSQYQLREPLLKEEVERTKKSLKKQEEEWSSSGCSIMTDAWTDRKRRSIMNLCVNCKEGTTFLSSKEDSEEAHTGEYIFKYVDDCIEQVGPQNVVQVVTDNASNNMAAADLLIIKRPHMFWTSCATHTLNLMLEGIGKLPKFKGVIEKARAFTIFIYAHHKTLALMRKHTKKRDIVRPGATRFATAFLTLQSLMEKKEKLRYMFTSTEWDQCKWSKSAKGKTAYATVLSLSFWNGVTLCLKVFAPLVKVLRLVDGERKPSMGFLYGELKKAKEEIKEAFTNNETNYRPILEIIDVKAKDWLDSPLHLAAYLLNPYYFFKDPSIQSDPLVMDAMFTCVEKFFPDDFDMQNIVINTELLKYKKKEGGFGRPLASAGCTRNDDNYDPVGWWSNYGNSTPNLQRMATRILSLTTSSSGCERNWSTFEGIHTKKRNRLDATRLNNLVYVQFNARLNNKKEREKDRKIDVLLASDASKAQGWIVEGGDDEVEGCSGLNWETVAEASGADSVLEPRRSSRNVGVRELHEEDFLSDNETDEEGDEEYECESDGDIILEGYGEEELEI